MIKIKSNKIITPDGLFDGYLYIEGDKIVEVSIIDKPSDVSYDMTGSYVSPGFIELHSHGAGGHAFMNSTVDDVLGGVEYHLKHGTTSILPTISAATFPTMREAVKNIDLAKKSGRAKAHILGAHLEGPYLSAKQCGAQCPTFITPPNECDYKALIKEYPDTVKRWTYAPENDDGSFCRYLTEHGVIASAGHTDAKYQDMLRAVDSGCRLITHFYSCTSTVTRDHGFRSLGVIESGYLLDELTLEIIADGKHLPLELIQLILKIKGKDKVLLCTDSLEIAGTDIKEGVMSGTEFIVEDGICKLRDRSAFAGSVATADRLIVTMVDSGVSVVDAVYMMTEVPARLMGLNKGRLANGYDADIIVLDNNLEITDVFVGQNKVF